jgi:ABC-type proline/glycine betaine transport system ATPase subunit
MDSLKRGPSLLAASMCVPPDEVVGAPADDYVKEFVSDVPKSHVLTLKG